MKYKVGDTVTIKSKEWYEENKDSNGKIPNKDPNKIIFNLKMSNCCGETFEIEEVFESNLGEGYYHLKDDENFWAWREWMFEIPDISLVRDILKDLSIEDYKDISNIDSFEVNKWIQSITTKEYSLWWNVEGERILVIRKIGIFKII